PTVATAGASPSTVACSSRARMSFGCRTAPRSCACFRRTGSERDADGAAQAGSIVVEPRLSAEVATGQLLEQPAAEAFSAGRCNGRATAFFPLQPQHSLPGVPRHADAAVGG